MIFHSKNKSRNINIFLDVRYASFTVMCLIITAQLAAELSIEKRKVAELETQLKASTSSLKVHKAIEDHMSTIQVSSLILLLGRASVPMCDNKGRHLNSTAPAQQIICHSS